MIIDFDWAGRTDADEPPRYPLSRNHADINWPEDSTAGGIITTNHDRWMMSEAWKDLRSQPQTESVWPPRPSVPPVGVSLEDWQDPVWQLAHRIRSAEELAQWIEPTAEEIRAIEDLSVHFRFVITPYYASLMDPEDPDCPLRKQVVPKPIELEDAAGLSDPLDEVAHSPVKNVIRVYPDRIAFCVNNECGLYCRYCLRKRMVGDESEAAARAARDCGVARDQERFHGWGKLETEMARVF